MAAVNAVPAMVAKGWIRGRGEVERFRKATGGSDAECLICMLARVFQATSEAQYEIRLAMSPPFTAWLSGASNWQLARSPWILELQISLVDG